MAWVRTDANAPSAHVLASHSLNREALAAHVRLYRAVMFGESPLSRVEREAMAVAVSAANDCHYWVVHHGDALTAVCGDGSLAEAVASGRFDELPPRLRALCVYAVKLTRAPAAMREVDVQVLRNLGCDDRAIVDANQVAAYFNYVNRVAHGLGVELEDTWPASVRRERSYDPTTVAAEDLPWISVAAMRELDRVAIDELGVSLVRMMENAGRNLASLARDLLGGDAAGRRIVVLAGPGGNGGGGLVAARHLLSAGAAVEVRLAAPLARFTPIPLEQLEILQRAGAVVREEGPIGPSDLVIDAVLGYSQLGAPRGEAATVIAAAAGRRTLSLDVPSGLELDTGVLGSPHVTAEATLTLAAPKAGLRSPAATAAVGALYLADLGLPPAAYERAGVPWRSPFGAASVVRIGAPGTAGAAA